MNNTTLNTPAKAPRRGIGAKAGRRLSNTIVYIILIAVTATWLFPFFGIVLESFRINTPQQVSYLWPSELGFGITKEGNLKLEDENGNVLVIHGALDASGRDRYNAMENAPQVGDTVTVVGKLVNTGDSVQIRNGWLNAEVGETQKLTFSEVQTTGSALEAGTYSETKYAVTGKITEVYGYSSQEYWAAFKEYYGFDNYRKLFNETDFLLWFKNTAIMGVATAFLQVFFILSVSYALSRMRFKGRQGLMNIMLILGMFPGFLTMILIYKVFAQAGLTLQMAPVGLIIVYCASSGMGYYVSKGFFDTIPKSLDEAARVDGATRFQVFYKVIMPMAKPIVIYTILMGFMAPWGDFMLASYIIHENSEGMNVAVGMYEWLSKTNLNTYYTMFCAGGVMVAVPVVSVFLMLQKYYVEGVTGGAVKG